jgi:protein TonB
VPIVPQFTVAQPTPPDAIHETAPMSAAPAHAGTAQAQALPMDYLSRLVAHLNAYKNYPYDARARRQQGTVRLRFVMDREGRVLSFAVVGSSGVSALDDEARSMIQRAQPLPPPPPSIPGATLDLVLPVVFSLH